MIAFWYHLDPRGLDGRRKAGLLANLPAMKAQHTLHMGNYDPGDYESVYHLYLVAFGDRVLAERARTRAIEVHLERMTNAAAHVDA